MKFLGTVFPACLLAVMLAAAPAAAGANSGLWLAAVSVNKVGEANSRIQDSLFDLGVSAVQPERQLIGKGSSDWSYHAGSALLPTWPNSASASGWPTGKAPLGYRLSNGSYLAPSGGSKVSFGSDPADKTPVAYFRKIFSTGDPAGLSSLRMRLWFDDGIQVFVNGVSVHSENLRADWSSVSAGASAHSAALRADGSLWTWGANGYGQLGDASLADSYSPTQVAAGEAFLAVAAGSGSTVAVKADGSLWSWGYAGYGQLGDAGQENRNVPQQVGADLDWRSVAAGGDFNLAVKSDGTLWGWGRNDAGQAGVGGGADVGVPTRIGSESDWMTVVAGHAHAAALKTDGTLWLWGRNDRGQLGDNGAADRSEPVRVGSAEARWSGVSAGYAHTLAVNEDGSLWSWGSNSDGRLGYAVGADQSTPKQVGVDADWRSVAAGSRSSLAVKKDGSLWGWGSGTFGSSAADSLYDEPARIGSDYDWLQVAAAVDAAEDRVLALRGSGKNALWGWGANGRGGLGDGSAVDRPRLTALASFFSASSESAADPAAYRELSIPTSVLTPGENSVAVEVHGAGADNSDLYFDLELTGMPAAPVELIPDKSAGWLYLDAATAAPAQWSLNSAGFSDSGWSSGAAPLGYLSPAQSSVRQTLLSKNPATVYYRKTVSVADPAGYSALNLRLLRDDGAVVYLNGKEIMRSNMPSGPVGFGAAPEQLVGPVEAHRYVTATVPLAAGDLAAGSNVFAVEVHQHAAELAAATTLGALTPAGAEFPLRFLLHVDDAGAVRLLKEAIIVKDAANNVVVLADSALAAGYSGVVLRGNTRVGVRTSAVGYDFSGSSVACTGALASGDSAECSFSLSASDAANPFLHRFHPDHDNLDERFADVLQGAAAESFEVARRIKLTFSSRYPANPDEPERAAAGKPPGWGATMLGGAFGETISGLHKDTLAVSGWFTVKRISAAAELKR